MRKILPVISLCFFLAGCVLGSVNAFYTPDLVVDVSELNGQWTYEDTKDPSDNALVVIQKGTITISDKGAPPADARLTFFKVGDELFADIYPQDGQLKFDLVGDGVPVHLICLVKQDNGRLLFNPLDYEWLIKQAGSGAINIPYKKSDSQTASDVVLTASPEEWVGFLKKYGNDPLAFPHTDEGWLIRK